jgi:tRNA-modifying protein YgfZ
MEPPPPDAPWLDAACDTVTVTGPDAMTYLQSQVSQELRDLPVGERRWTFLLDPSGRVVVLARVTRTSEESFTLDTDPGFGPALLDRIDRFKIRVKAETSLEDASATAPPDLEATRIERGWPKMGAEIAPGETIPAETGLARVAVNFTKGCYPGQELVERMDSRGATAPRSLRRLRVDEGAAPGDPVVDDSGAQVGVLTSVHGTVALGYVKRGHDVGEIVEQG